MTKALAHAGVTILTSETNLVKCRLDEVYDQITGAVVQKQVRFRVEFGPCTTQTHTQLILAEATLWRTTDSKTSDSTSDVHADVAHPKQWRIYLDGHFGVGERCSVDVQGCVPASEGDVGVRFSREDVRRRVRRGWINSQAAERHCMMITRLFFFSLFTVKLIQYFSI
jgi:hypothetical protein